MKNSTITSFKQFFSFCIIGVFNTGIHFLLFIQIMEFVTSQTIANFLGFVGGVIFSFFMNARFTFQKKASVGRLGKMFLVSGSLSLIFGGAGDLFSWHPYLTFLVFIIFNPIVSFVLTKKIVFN